MNARSAPTKNLVAQLEAFVLDKVVIVERPLRRPGTAEVRVRVRAASLNHRDVLFVRGQLTSETRLPRVLLSDCAGEVVEIGSNVTRVRIGDRVAAATMPDWVTGAFSSEMAASALGWAADGVLGEYFIGHQRGFVHIPEALSFEEGATLPCAALTAWNALFEHGDLRPGHTVLIQGTGGVSIFALQLAVGAGARVIATSGSEAKLERLRQLGAVCVINYREQPEWSRTVLEFTGGRGVDQVIETGGAATLDQSIRSAAVGGLISVIGQLTGATGTFDTLPVLRKALRLQGIVVGSVEMLERMNGTIEALGIRPVIDRTFEMQEIVPALKYLESGRHVGKVVVRVGGSDARKHGVNHD
jgi:NADPH:quinone reductase-like Zn-dependent oxidoreductase